MPRERELLDRAVRRIIAVQTAGKKLREEIERLRQERLRAEGVASSRRPTAFYRQH